MRLPLTLVPLSQATGSPVNTIDPWQLRHRAVEELQRLRSEGRVADGIRIGDECRSEDARLRYAD